MSFIVFSNTKNPIKTIFTGITKKAKYSNGQRYHYQDGAIPQLVARWTLTPTTRIQVLLKTSYLHKCYPSSTQRGLMGNQKRVHPILYLCGIGCKRTLVIELDDKVSVYLIIIVIIRLYIVIN